MATEARSAVLGPYCTLDGIEEVFTLTEEGLFEPPQSLCRFATPLGGDMTYHGDVTCETPLFLDVDNPNLPSQIVTSGYHLDLYPSPDQSTLFHARNGGVPVDLIHCHAAWPN